MTVAQGSAACRRRWPCERSLFNEQARAEDKKLYCCFVDLKQLYDPGATTPALGGSLERRGVAGWELAAITALCANAAMCIKGADGCSGSLVLTLIDCTSSWH